jgi:hypothetical protein
VTVASDGDTRGSEAPLITPSNDVRDGDTRRDGEDVVRPGDEHVSGVESLCVGESQ